jgi:hypothetical protein
MKKEKEMRQKEKNRKMRQLEESISKLGRKITLADELSVIDGIYRDLVERIWVAYGYCWIFAGTFTMVKTFDANGKDVTLNEMGIDWNEFNGILNRYGGNLLIQPILGLPRQWRPDPQKITVILYDDETPVDLVDRVMERAVYGYVDFDIAALRFREK